MTQSNYLKQSYYLGIASLVVLIMAVIAAGLNGGQEHFEILRPVGDYTKALIAAKEALRLVLFFDSIFLVFYLGAIGFSIIGFAERNIPAAWISGIALILLVVFDIWENITMVQSIDLLGLGQALTFEQMVHQVTVSSFKWAAAAITLFSISFILPNERIFEKLLVWGTRLGLLIAVPIFVFNPAGLHDIGGILIYITMLSGFVLLAIVARGRMNEG